MSYMNRKDRRESILEAACALALAKGLNALTIRNVSLQADISVGQIHHHFSSSGQMKSEVLIRLIRDLIDKSFQNEETSKVDELIRFLKSDDGSLEAYIRVWREAQVTAESDSDVRAAYLEVMVLWNARTAELIRLACDAGECVISDTYEDTAWRLSSFVCGLDGSYALGLISQSNAHRYLERIVRLELSII